MLKDKIMELYNERKVKFDDEAASSNLASITTTSLQHNVMVKTVKFGSFEPVILALTVEEVKDPQGSGGNIRSQVDANDDDEGWTLVTHRKGGKKTSTKPAKVLERSKMIRQSTKKPKPKVTKKKVT